ncbi:MAG: V-type ATP synthase subunit F [Nanoarchaeota archaeon]|nr:MAG: V-type ATP synthase subunit F [Nanoarchaeota archaeon]
MSEIGVLGSDEFTLGFKLIGINKVFHSEQAFETIRSAMQDPELGILVVEEDALAGMHPEDRQQIENSVKPVIVILSKQGSSESLRQSIIRAIGVDLWKEEQ